MFIIIYSTECYFHYYYLNNLISIHEIICFCRKRHEESIKDIEKKQDSCKESLTKLQQQYQQAQVKAAAKA